MKISELNDLVKEFLEFHNLKFNSQRAYKTDLKFFIEFIVSEKTELENLKRKDLLNWLKNYNSRVSNRRGVNIRKFLLWLKKEKQILIPEEFSLPWQFTDPQPVKPDQTADLTEDEINSLFTNRYLSLNKKAILILLLNTAAPIENLATLTWQDICLDKLSYLKLGSDGNERIISLEKPIVNLLKELKEKNNQASHEFVFCQENTAEPINAPYLAILIKRSLQKALNKNISATQLQELAQKRLTEKYKLPIALNILGLKKAHSILTSSPDSQIDLVKLKNIHQSAFA